MLLRILPALRDGDPMRPIVFAVLLFVGWCGFAKADDAASIGRGYTAWVEFCIGEHITRPQMSEFLKRSGKRTLAAACQCAVEKVLSNNIVVLPGRLQETVSSEIFRTQLRVCLAIDD